MVRFTPFQRRHGILRLDHPCSSAEIKYLGTWLCGSLFSVTVVLASDSVSE
jgi:hypothetical protein